MIIGDIEGFGSYGGVITGIDLSKITPDDFLSLGKLHLKQLVTVVPSACTNLNLNQFHELCSHWGDFYVRKAVVDLTLRKDLTPIQHQAIDSINRYRSGIEHLKGMIPITGKRDNEGRTLGMFADGELDWHTNGSAVTDEFKEPCIALLAVSGTKNSCTEFLQTADAYSLLSNDWKNLIKELKAVHGWKDGSSTPNLNPEQLEIARLNLAPEEDVVLPVKCVSPGGIEGIYFPYNTIKGFVGYSEKDSNEIYQYLFNHFIKREYVYSHQWDDGDLIWMDQTITLHRRPTKDCSQRLLYRLCHTYDFLLGKRARPPYEELVKGSHPGSY
jgi:alpha-ketoglutarate-dependent taurine dioxygenase